MATIRCDGGPLDGQTVAVPDGARELAVLLAPTDPGWPYPPEGHVRVGYYHLEVWRDGETDAGRLVFRWDGTEAR